MDKPYFIMAYTQDGQAAFPIVDERDEVAFYASEEDARDVARSHFYASNFGYEIFEMGSGE